MADKHLVDDSCNIHCGSVIHLYRLTIH